MSLLISLEIGFKIRCGHTWINVCPNSEECTDGIPLNNKKSIKPSKDKHPLTKFYYILSPFQEVAQQSHVCAQCWLPSVKKDLRCYAGCGWKGKLINLSSEYPVEMENPTVVNTPGGMNRREFSLIFSSTKLNCWGNWIQSCRGLEENCGKQSAIGCEPGTVYSHFARCSIS